ncbi:ceramidase domain-containing protein [Methylocystis sp. SB2]|uniref:ceramidase domain-containing protein n=1 Tax=Methylocystis sp. (strain SB2) TaxID=743836 RepID=UPI0004A2AD82|nr:ceramidase domain-containing protein [Methylocystis sp. SB2]ULO24722.1 ceramidase [Methylocystis sp. SB2]
MDWRAPVMDYCERQSSAFWAEPANALSNFAFVIAAASAFLLWRRRGGADYPALALIIVTASVGVGSFVFHTVATRGAMLLDVVPIALFIYGYFLLALRRYFRLSIVWATAITLGFAAGSSFATTVDALNGSVGYLPALAALAIFAALLWTSRRETGRALAAAALLFAISLVFRTIDRAICPAIPLGAHVLWHMLNACVLWLLLRAAIIAGPRGDQASPIQNAKEPTAA